MPLTSKHKQNHTNRATFVCGRVRHACNKLYNRFPGSFESYPTLQDTVILVSKQGGAMQSFVAKYQNICMTVVQVPCASYVRISTTMPKLVNMFWSNTPPVGHFVVRLKIIRLFPGIQLFWDSAGNNKKIETLGKKRNFLFSFIVFYRCVCHYTFYPVY